VPKYPPQFTSLSFHILRPVTAKTVGWYNTTTSLHSVLIARELYLLVLSFNVLTELLTVILIY